MIGLLITYKNGDTEIFLLDSETSKNDLIDYIFGKYSYIPKEILKIENIPLVNKLSIEKSLINQLARLTKLSIKNDKGTIK